MRELLCKKCYLNTLNIGVLFSNVLTSNKLFLNLR